MADKLTPPPAVGSDRFADWLFKLWQFLNNLNLTQTPSVLSQVQATDLTDGGDSAAHFHPSDRDRNNHTGTQTASTISDFNAAVLSLTASSGGTSRNDALAAQIFGS